MARSLFSICKKYLLACSHAALDVDGTVLALQWVSGRRELMQSAMDAVKQWRYQPTLLNGELVQVDTTITTVYKLSRH